VLSFSAFNDPLTGEKLKLDPAARALLNDGGDAGAFSSSRLALDPRDRATAAGKPKELVRFFRGLMGEGR
jgi:hypothetical protein